MQQIQNGQRVNNNQIGQERNGRLSIKYGQRQGTNPGYHLFSEEDEDESDVSEIPGEHHNKEGQHEYKVPTGEQRRRIADQHEHPFQDENSPWRRQQTPTTIQGNNA